MGYGIARTAFFRGLASPIFREYVFWHTRPKFCSCFPARLFQVFPRPLALSVHQKLLSVGFLPAQETSHILFYNPYSFSSWSIPLVRRLYHETLLQSNFAMPTRYSSHRVPLFRLAPTLYSSHRVPLFGALPGWPCSPSCRCCAWCFPGALLFDCAFIVRDSPYFVKPFFKVFLIFF